MRILIAEDDSAFGDLLADILDRWGYQVVVTRNGDEAWQALSGTDAPRLAILDWMMPGMSGVDICRRVRDERKEPYIYLILLTSQQRDEDLITGMEAGADDYLAKPLKVDELRVRLNAGRRMVELQNELLTALSKVKRLEGVIPICASCKKIRDDKESWQQLEQYISEHSDAMFSHGICPECFEKQISEVNKLKPARPHEP